MSKRALRAALAVVFIFGYPKSTSPQPTTSPAQEPTYKYDTPGIQLAGTLTERKVYGPPGYGETPARDAKETILVLKLHHTIAVAPTADAEAKGSANLDPAKDIRELQLFVGRDRQADARKLIGRTVSVTGTLNESLTASQRTQVWMDVMTLAPR